MGIVPGAVWQASVPMIAAFMIRKESLERPEGTAIFSVLLNKNMPMPLRQHLAVGIVPRAVWHS